MVDYSKRSHPLSQEQGKPSRSKSDDGWKIFAFTRVIELQSVNHRMGWARFLSVQTQESKMLRLLCSVTFLVRGLIMRLRLLTSSPEVSWENLFLWFKPKCFLGSRSLKIYRQWNWVPSPVTATKIVQSASKNMDTTFLIQSLWFLSVCIVFNGAGSLW